jgi:hypothetical protein
LGIKLKGVVVAEGKRRFSWGWFWIIVAAIAILTGRVKFQPDGPPSHHMCDSIRTLVGIAGEALLAPPVGARPRLRSRDRRRRVFT